MYKVRNFHAFLHCFCEGTEQIQKQIKSKKRVRDKGEVFTNEREVNAMLDLVKQETERVDSTFLEIKVAC